MKRIFASFILIALLFIFDIGCKKADSLRDIGSDQVLITNARNFFEKQVSTNIPDEQLFHYNPRLTSFKHPLWERASAVNLTSRRAIVVPVRYEKNLFFATDFSGKYLLDVNDLSRLLIYQDGNKTYHVELLTFIPDSSYSSSRQKFSGLILVEDWVGNTIKKISCDRDGVSHQLDIQLPAMTVSTDVNKRSDKLVAVEVKVCYNIDGYNYSADDPSNGEYWSESGCNYYSFNGGGGDGGGGGGLSGGDYGGIAGSEGSQINTKRMDILVALANKPIQDIKEYLKCFADINDDRQADYSVTVCVKQPVPGTRESWSLSDKGSSARGDWSSGSNSPISPGHTFLIMTEKTTTNTIVRNIGFCPNGCM